MKQTGNTIDPGSIQHFADSAENAIAMGQRQFFTPPAFAKALFTPLAAVSAISCHDLMAGNGALLAASGRRQCFGLDVDERVTAIADDKPAWHTAQADITRWYPLATAACFRADLLALNPPFSLRWHLSRLSALRDSHVPGVANAYLEAREKGKTIDSTLGSLLIALDLLSHYGEGFMVCNADTARRLIGNPEAPADRPRLMRNIWAWLEVPGVSYENQHTAFDTAVLYFSPSHGEANHRENPPLFLRAPSSDPDTVAMTLSAAASARPLMRLGPSLSAPHYAITADAARESWQSVNHEYAQLHLGAKPFWNLRIDPATGRIRTYLDPFRKASYRHDTALLNAFRTMDGEAPASLVVQQITRAALRHALASDCWRVEPALVAAVDAAIAAYEQARAPFYMPNAVQSLGWIDEASTIACIRSGIPGIDSGDVLPLRSWIEDTKWKSTKLNMEGKEEALHLSGRELVVEVTSADGTAHQFHVRRDDEAENMNGSVSPSQHRNSSQPGEGKGPVHHTIETFLEHFGIPAPLDIAQQNPEAYQEAMDRLTELETWINAA